MELKSNVCPKCGGKLWVREESEDSASAMVCCEDCDLNFTIGVKKEESLDGLLKSIGEIIDSIQFPDDKEDSGEDHDKVKPEESVLADVYGVEVVKRIRKQREESETPCDEWNNIVGRFENAYDCLDSVMGMIDEMSECAIETRKVLNDAKKYVHKAVKKADDLMKKNEFFTKWAFDYREKDSEEVTAKQFKSDIYNILKRLNGFNAVDAGEIMAYAASHKIIEAE